MSGHPWGTSMTVDDWKRCFHQERDRADGYLAELALLRKVAEAAEIVYEKDPTVAEHAAIGDALRAWKEASANARNSGK